MTSMWRFLFVLLFVCAATLLADRATSGAPPAAGVAPPAGIGAIIPLWPRGANIARPVTTGPETTVVGHKLIGGQPITAVQNVTEPLMAVYAPQGKNTGTAVLVFPGGGYQALAIDLEGSDVCFWLAPKGVTCAVVKYRVPGSGPGWNDDCKCHRDVKIPMALQDAQRAIRLLRQQAAALHIDPHKIGVIGFSAGGHMVADVSNHLDIAYVPVDGADKLSSRPDFAIALYPGHLWSGSGLTLHPRNTINPHAPPTLLIQAQDDPVDDVRNSLVYFAALTAAKVPVEYHVYAHGGHAFGLRRTDAQITHWTDLAETWMRGLGVLPR